MDQTFAVDPIWGESLQNKERLYLLLWLIKAEQHETATELWSEERSESFVLFVFWKGIKGGGKDENKWRGHFRPEAAAKRCACQEDGAPRVKPVCEETASKQCRLQRAQHIDQLEKNDRVSASLRKQVSGWNLSSKQGVASVSPAKLLDKRHVGEMHLLADCNKLPVDSSQIRSAIPSGRAN